MICSSISYIYIHCLGPHFLLCVHAAEKDRELGEAHTEIKALKHSERLKEKAVEEVTTLLSDLISFPMLD